MDIIQVLFSFKGRVTRKTYWLFMVASVLLVLLPVFTVIDLGSKEADYYTTLMSLVLLWPALAIQAKRWHDRDKSAVWILINFVPFIGWPWALIENWLLSGTNGDNHYGPNPLAENKTT